MSQEVTVLQMMEAREHRAYIQNKMIEEFKLPLVSFTLNIPGPVKTGEDIRWAFEKAKTEIADCLDKAGYPVKNESMELEDTGYEYFASVDGNPLNIKKLLVRLEEETSLGRLYDIDVIQTDGMKISRKDIGMEERKCIICQEKAYICSRNRTHKVSELVSRIHEIIQESQ